MGEHDRKEGGKGGVDSRNVTKCHGVDELTLGRCRLRVERKPTKKSVKTVT